MCRCHCPLFFFFSSRRRHTRCSRDWSSDVCSSDLVLQVTRILISITIPSRSCCGGTLKYGATLKNVCSPGHGRCEWPVSNGSTLQPASQVFRSYPFEFRMVAVV